MVTPQDGAPDVDNWPTSELARLADRVRSPFLTLGAFLDEPIDHGDDWDDDNAAEQEELGLLAAGVSGERVYAARLRRAALLWAAHRAIDRCTEDLQFQDWDPATGVLTWDEDGDLEGPFLWEYFPPRYRHAYTRDFLAKVLVSAVKVAYDLARPDADHATCLAEELILNAICQIAEQAWDLAGLGRPWLAPEELLLEDTDFEVLFDEEMDGIEDDAARQLDLAMSVPGIQNWFTPFNTGRIVHPYCETQRSGPKANDLFHLLDPAERDQLHDLGIVDDPAPLTGLKAISEAVQHARDEHDAGRDGVWVPDPLRAEQSFADLLALVGNQAVSGWLTWAPEEGSDLIRTQPVIHFRPHRHFPATTDQPWAEITPTSAMIYVPLSAVVAFRVDPEVRRSWEQTWTDLLGPALS